MVSCLSNSVVNFLIRNNNRHQPYTFFLASSSTVFTMDIWVRIRKNASGRLKSIHICKFYPLLALIICIHSWLCLRQCSNSDVFSSLPLLVCCTEAELMVVGRICTMILVLLAMAWLPVLQVHQTASRVIIPQTTTL